MSAVRRSIPIIEKYCRLLGSRPIHTTSQYGAKHSPKRSPRISRGRGSVHTPMLQMRKEFDPEESLPPITLLHAAARSGALDVEPEKSLDVLRRYQELAGKSIENWEQKLCTEYEIPPSTLNLLARILNRCAGKGQKLLARQVMVSASNLGDTSATLELVSSAIRTESLNVSAFGPPLQKLRTLAKEGHNPQAMMLLGKVLLSQGRREEALQWFRKATRSQPDSLNFEGAGEALVNEGCILIDSKDRENAQVAFKKAALELDHPSAYFYLSKLEERGSSQEQVYLLKAASSGIAEAWHELGILEMSKIAEHTHVPDSVRGYGMAREWFQIAAESGYGLSMLKMASICKAGGQPDDGLKWLEKAEELPDVRESARSMKAEW